MLKLDLENLEKLERIFNELNELNLFKEARDVYYFLNNLLSANLKTDNIELVKNFKLLRAKFGFLVISSLPEKDVLHLYNYYMGAALNILDYNLWDNLKKYLIAFPDYDYRNEVKKKIRNIIAKNESLITKSALLINNVKVWGTAENWFKDYNSYVGTLASVDKLKFEEYFLNSQNVKNLEKEEKEKVKNLFQFYEKLKLSSKTPEGFEDVVPIVVDGKLKIWKDGNLEDIDENAKKAVEDLERLGFFQEDEKENRLKELNLMLTQYPPNSLERKAIEEEIGKLGD